MRWGVLANPNIPGVVRPAGGPLQSLTFRTRLSSIPGSASRGPIHRAVIGLPEEIDFNAKTQRRIDTTQRGPEKGRIFHQASAQRRPFRSWKPAAWKGCAT